MPFLGVGLHRPADSQTGPPEIRREASGPSKTFPKNTQRTQQGIKPNPVMDRDLLRSQERLEPRRQRDWVAKRFKAKGIAKEDLECVYSEMQEGLTSRHLPTDALSQHSIRTRPPFPHAPILTLESVPLTLRNGSKVLLHSRSIAMTTSDVSCKFECCVLAKVHDHTTHQGTDLTISTTSGHTCSRTRLPRRETPWLHMLSRRTRSPLIAKRALLSSHTKPSPLRLILPTVLRLLR
jgi:hypothetical protein